MPANTVNRGYPYPLPGDPTNPPGDLQALAEAIDNDLESIEAMIVSRPFAKVSGRTENPQQIPANVSTTVIYDFQDYDNDDMANLADEPSVLTINTAGIYWVMASVTWPSVSVSTTAQYDMFVRQSGTDRGRRTSQGGTPGAPSVGGAYSFGTLMQCVAGDQISITVQHNIVSLSNTFQIRNRQLVAFRLAN